MMWFKVNIKNNVVEAEAGLIDLLMGGRRSKPFNHGCGFSMSCSFRTTDVILMPTKMKKGLSTETQTLFTFRLEPFGSGICANSRSQGLIRHHFDAVQFGSASAVAGPRNSVDLSIDNDRAGAVAALLEGRQFLPLHCPCI